MLRRDAGDARLLLADRNHGYGAAANLALRDGDSELVCVSNGDLLPHPTALARLADAARGDPGVGMVGPVFEGGTQDYHARLPGPGILLGRTLVGSFGRRRQRVPSPSEKIVVGQASGACFVMRRELWERLGGFDDGFFLWYDDVDLAKRIVDSGYRNLVVGSAVVRHAGAGSFVQIEPATAQAIRLDSLERFIDKHHPRWMPVARPLLAVARALRARDAASWRGYPGSVGRLDRGEPVSGAARGHERHSAMPREMREVGRDYVP